ncbi:MAG: hypothetical protein LQ342_003661 [Letrouitia transgressa]|nr:MAG: hypothetical protein LQ342_003661 [Letrouitia transgressa]
MADTSDLSGSWLPTRFGAVHYGPSSVARHLLSSLPAPNSRAFIITTNSLATKTPLVRDVECLLTSKYHAATFSSISQHAPVAQLDQATDLVCKDLAIDTIISIGGGSPIDGAKIVSHRLHGKTGKYLFHITIPTTLSAAECTFGAGYTSADGQKVGTGAPDLAPNVIIYDSKFALETPERLWLSTGIRALDHAVESQYHSEAPEAPTKKIAMTAIADLFELLPRYKKYPKDESIITQLQLAAFDSLFGIGMAIADGLGLSHAIGYALGAPYGIPHGITSCLTLAGVVRLKAKDPDQAEWIARIASWIGLERSGNDTEDALKVGDAIEKLVRDLGLTTQLKRDHGVGEDQVPVIAKLATKAESGELFEGVASIVRSKL